MTAVLPEPPVLSFVGGRLASLARKHRVPGAQLAIHHDGYTVAVEFGEAEYGTRRRMTADTAVPVGSITKVCTATTAMILVADGDLDLDGPLGDYLAELPDVGDQLTLRQVLSHTAGLPAGPDAEEVSTATPRRYLLDHCRARHLVQPPGTGFSYSNLGFVLTGQLIETITGMDWWEAVGSILLRPLSIEPAAIVGPGLRATGRPVAAGHSANLTTGRIRPVRQALPAVEAPAGALALSATDLLGLGLLHLDPGRPDLLPPVYTGQMREPVPWAEPFGLADGWGLGLALFEAEDGTRWVGHDGNADGTACHLRVDPVNGWVIAFTGNANTGLGLWQDLLAELAGTDLPISPPRTAIRPAGTAVPPPGCAGTYVNGGMEYVVAPGNGGLYLSVDGDPSVRLTFHDGMVFSHRDPSSGRQVVGGRFVADPRTGRVRAIQIGGRLATRRLHPAREAARRQIA